MSTVLLVDDSPSDRALFRTILGRAGFEVAELSRGLEAVAKARQLRPHIVVLDLNLPDTDGFDVCRSLRADPICSGLPILMLTVRGHDDGDILAALEAGADDYLNKDEPSELILARVNRLVQFRKLSTLSVLNEQLAQVGRLVAGIVHEIRGPLSVIRGNVELMGMELADHPGQQWVEPILRAAITLQLRLDHLMAAVRTGPSDPSPLDIRPIVREATSLFHKGTDHRRGRVSVTVQVEGDTPTVRADAGRMIQVLLNLLANAHEAILASRPEGKIVVRARSEIHPEQEWVRIDVIDDGPGINPTHLARIFEPFFTTKDGGTGYGLYLASEILREHGGRLTAENHDGGACLSVWLPSMTSLLESGDGGDSSGENRDESR